MIRKGWFLAAILTALTFTATGANAAGHVFALRGLVNVFSYGMDEMVEKTKRRGVSASAHNHAEFHSLAAQAADMVKSGRGPIIIIGHSYGADAAVYMANRMNELGAPVALLVLFGPTHDHAIPGNVREVLNYYQTGSALWRGRALRGPGFRGSINNVNLDGAKDVTHFNIEKIGRLHNQALGRISAAAGRGRPARGAPTATAASSGSAPAGTSQ